ncbi:glycosyltransferase [Rhodoligotrophos defluvii]|uniref:glycosyltransferase n=1 Tax=Rhodoligotrophos defluvii TaxID=2561934 RepID=UPI0010C93DD9|nr:glycosyltransferase family 2 protein [Rhodoligotrophos defluvii]
MFPALAIACLVLALIPFLLCLMNLFLYRPPQAVAPAGIPPVSVLIPARNEEAGIARTLEAVLANRGCSFEVVVADDSSTDHTRAIVEDFVRRDPRVRLIATPPLPPGWMGKNNACQTLAAAARHDIALFVDADVHLAPDAVARIAGCLVRRRLSLASGFPHQITRGFWEKLMVPLIHFVLLGFLPMIGARLSNWPAFATGCGQLIAVRLSDYRAIGGHGAIRGLIHDGVQLPRLFRRHGLRTDLFDAETLAATQMYGNFRDLWAGFSKNAHEGMATPVALPIWTVLLFGGQVLPFLLWPVAWFGSADPVARWALAAAIGCAWAMRLALALRFHQSWLSALLHPFGILVTLALQWMALWRWHGGKEVRWRGRAYSRS